MLNSLLIFFFIFHAVILSTVYSVYVKEALY